MVKKKKIPIYPKDFSKCLGVKCDDNSINEKIRSILKMGGNWVYSGDTLVALCEDEILITKILKIYRFNNPS